MRVLQLLKTGTGATWASRQMVELRRHGLAVHVAMPDGPTADLCRAAGCEVHVVDLGLPVRHPAAIPATLARMRHLVDAVAPDVIHSHFVSTTLTMRLALGGKHPVPRIFQVPGPLHLEHPVTARAEVASASAPDVWIASCHWTQRRYQQLGVAPERTFLARYGIELDRWVPAPPGRLRAELGLAPSTKIVGMVAYFYAPRRWLGQRAGIKGHEDLIDAMALVRARHPDTVAVFVGGPWAGATAYQAEVEAYGRARLGAAAHFLGTRTDVRELYADMDVTAHPSHSENTGAAPEAFILGRPVIATAIGGFPDVVIDGVTGWLVPARAPSALADAIVDALASPERTRALTAAGTALTKSLFDVEQSTATIRAIYRDLVTRARTR